MVRHCDHGLSRSWKVEACEKEKKKPSIAHTSHRSHGVGLTTWLLLLPLAAVSLAPRKSTTASCMELAPGIRDVPARVRLAMVLRRPHQKRKERLALSRVDDGGSSDEEHARRVRLL